MFAERFSDKNKDMDEHVVVRLCIKCITLNRVAQ